MLVYAVGIHPPEPHSCMKRFYFKQRDVVQLSAKTTPTPKFGSLPAIGCCELIVHIQYSRVEASNLFLGGPSRAATAPGYNNLNVLGIIGCVFVCSNFGVAAVVRTSAMAANWTGEA